MRINKVLFDPCYEVIFESAFYNLMEEVGRDELVDVSSRKVLHERLTDKLVYKMM